jgi:hypothetical protein
MARKVLAIASLFVASTDALTVGAPSITARPACVASRGALFDVE